MSPTPWHRFTETGMGNHSYAMRCRDCAALVGRGPADVALHAEWHDRLDCHPSESAGGTPKTATE